MTSKQRAYLKSLAMTMDPIFQVGKNSVTTESVEALIVPLVTDCGKIEVNVAIRERA